MKKGNIMFNGISSRVPYANYPYNAVGATPVTKDIASTCFDTQRPHIQQTMDYLCDNSRPSYTWPIIGALVSAISFITVCAIKKRP